jgi:hypothetical protein
MPPAKLWAGAIGAWVLLADLLSVVKLEARVPPEAAARVLREPLESCAIEAEVVRPGDRLEFRDAAATRLGCVLDRSGALYRKARS